jgi:hypothetical protein
MSMDLSRETFENILEEAELDPSEVIREGYSGRAMYGATCPALSLDSDGQLARFMVAAGRVQADIENGADGEEFNAIKLADMVRTDSMGYGIVAYFPGLTLTGEDETVGAATR